ncbi:winged helix-turn-helix domain-containing protein [Geodermatophilus sp. YIM 151500]|uniref:winged helix-turn-helix domain-containing protein n=1 Tax=Geodermatophilus sp. YIM 151500 TaxID=2984531 RepID=UPI0021E3617F|nr:winged helix-turn-helix domain-containing protein [Geodermatophilus sp. YIM 151500]MCV2488090.1 winged helix-turn-helix domain-containing protein [Geodermatophilus sp. YIM 151500]
MVRPAVRQERAFVGRQGELDVLADLVDGDAGRVGYVHGIAGVGKSALLRRFLRSARNSGTSVVELDCRTVEPTERGVLAATGGFGNVAELLTHLALLPRPVVLALDHCEAFRLMDTWLRQVLAPALPDGVALLLAGRTPPLSGWFAVEGFCSLPLEPLDEPDALELLDRLGVPPGEAVRVNRVARGHPLALVLASAGIAEHPHLALEDAAMARVVDELARSYLDGGDDALARRALEAASVVRRATGPVLSAMLPDADGDDAVDRLLGQPFVDSCRDGLVVHEAVKNAVADFLRGAHPRRYLGYRRAAWRELRAQAREAPARELWRYTADMLYLIDNPVVREAFFPSGTQPMAVEPARPRDLAAIRSIARRHDGPESVAVLERWWDAAPDCFSVVRDRIGAVAGFFLLLGDHLRRTTVPGDVVTDAWVRHLRDHPLPRGQVALGLRRWLDAAHGESPCAAQAACWLDVKRTYLALRPALRRMFVVVRDVATYWPVVEELGFRPLPQEPVELDGARYGSVVLDFGPDSVDGWLASLVGAQLGLQRGDGLDEDSRELTVQGSPRVLTPLELGLFRHLRDRAGRPVGRAELLREVWGTRYTGGSNVVDAVVRTLRVKLGPAADVVETVRGAGYRLRADWCDHLG